MNEVAIIQLMHTNGLGPKTLDRLLARLAIEGREPKDAVFDSPDELTARYGLNPGIAERIESSREDAETLYKELVRHGITTLVTGHSDYPDRLISVLGDDAPPVLFVRGDPAILRKKCAGFCGARDASSAGLSAASKCAGSLAGRGINIVSGYAPGVDVASHRAALKTGGTTTFVLAEGILNFRGKRDVTPWLSDDNHIVLSQFLPRTVWAARNAIQRNRTICALSHAVILIEAGMTGGTFSSGEAALKQKRPLFVADFHSQSPTAKGNSYFINRGASPILFSDYGEPVLDELLETIERDKDLCPISSQARLFD